MKLEFIENPKANANKHGIKIKDKYKHWTVIDGPFRNKHGALVWLCECDCHKTKRYFQGNALVKPDANFQCLKCSVPERTEHFLQTKGKTGNLHQGKFSKIQRCAKARNIEFTLTKEYLNNLFEEQNGICAITGDSLNDINKASLDRIDSNKPYIEGNVQWVTVQANKSKHILSMQELYEFCRKVLNHANQQPSQEI